MAAREEPAPPVEAFQWVVFYGTCWANVVAVTIDDARIIGMARAGTTNPRDVRVRRRTVKDDEREAQWREVADQLKLGAR